MNFADLSFFERCAVGAQYLLPKQALTVLMGHLAEARGGWLTQAAIRRFVARYQVDMSEAAQPDIKGFACFNDFFTRALRPELRPLAQSTLVCPVDGAISQLGSLTEDQIVQAKGHSYSSLALLGGDAECAAAFQNGQFATLYLSPKDYHRIHMPLAGRLRQMTHVPGALFSVNPSTARGVPGLFARNERLVCVFDSLSSAYSGPFALVLVGATIVGSMATVWQGRIEPHPRQIRHWRFDDRNIRLAQGEEMGRFLLGSTVVALFAGQQFRFPADWQAGRCIRLGEAMSQSTTSAATASAESGI